jgi:hypothetical protein
MRKMIEVMWFTLITLLRVCRHSRLKSATHKLPLVSDKCYIFGNGPSLSDDLVKCKDLKSLGDVWCVNHFANCDEYQTVKPKYYVFADPDFWADNLSVNFVGKREQFFITLAKRTTWPLIIYVPNNARLYVESLFANHINITVKGFNNITPSGWKKMIKVLYDLGLAMPHIQNVLVATLFLSLKVGYKEIILLGSDHSWHETLLLDDANRVCLRDKHFYDHASALTPFYKDGAEQETFKMHEILFAFSKMFEGYWEVKEYSESVGAEIINASSITFIDAFRRVKPEKFLIEKSTF